MSSTKATRVVSKKIALIFDFDGTLGPGTFEHVMEHCGLDPELVDQERLDPRVEHDWEHTLARARTLIDLAQERTDLTEDSLKEIGRDYPLYPGVPEMFDRVRETAKAVVEDVEVEFYLMTAGFSTIPKATPIAKEFTKVFSGALYFDEDGRPAFVKRVLTHPEKPKYLLHLAKGLDVEGANPNKAYRKLEEHEWYMPIDQMIYVGDGASDLPAFHLVSEYGGIPIAVFESERSKDWAGYSEVRSSQRVDNLAPNDYSENGEMLNSLLLATECICKRIALRKMSQDQ
jgi:phosphoserine phosphatase